MFFCATARSRRAAVAVANLPWQSQVDAAQFWSGLLSCATSSYVKWVELKRAQPHQHFANLIGFHSASNGVHRTYECLLFFLVEMSVKNLFRQESSDVENHLDNAIKNTNTALETGSSAAASQSYGQIVQVLAQPNLYPSIKYVNMPSLEPFNTFACVCFQREIVQRRMDSNRQFWVESWRHHERIVASGLSEFYRVPPTERSTGMDRIVSDIAQQKFVSLTRVNESVEEKARSTANVFFCL